VKSKNMYVIFLFGVIIIVRVLMKKNCWEYSRCGRERGGRNEKELGICPAAAEERLNGVHGGINAGRACWAVAQVFCDCTRCNFFQLVREEEGTNYETSLALLKRLTTSK